MKLPIAKLRQMSTYPLSLKTFDLRLTTPPNPKFPTLPEFYSTLHNRSVFSYSVKTSVTLFLLLFIAFGNSNAQSVIRGPYLTAATPHSIVISWRTDIPCNSLVNYGPSPFLFSGGLVNNTPVTEHVIKLSGLNPATTYFYSIGTTTASLQGNGNTFFKTLPIASPAYNKPIRMLAVGDVAKATVNEEWMRDAMLHYLDTNTLDGYLMLGDNAYPYGFDVNWQDGFFNYFQQSLLPHVTLWPATGNHEYANDYNLRLSHAIPYFDIFTLPTLGESGGIPSHTEQYYSFDIGNAHFINLDSYGLENVGGTWYGFTDTVFSPQFQWLKQDLAANHLPWVIVSFHHPPYGMGTHNSDLETDLVAIREKLNPIFERFNVDLVLNGHDHTYQRSMFMHRHYGMEATFDTLQHRVQNSSGKDDQSALSCPFVKNSIPPLPSDSGLLYVVIGSGSDYPQASQPTWPHDAMYYANNTDNGSLLLTITGNRLQGEWISTDSTQVVKDRFVIYKNVNRRQQLTVPPGIPLTLTASWDRPNDYTWSTGDSSRSITLIPTGPITLAVQDKNGCLLDSFFIQIGAPLGHASSTPDELLISPNPANQTLRISGLARGQYFLGLADSEGRIVLRQQLEQRGPEPLLIPVGHLAEGIYRLEIGNGNGKSTVHRVVLAHGR